MTYLALFRGINVGGKNVVKMAELRQLLTELGLDGVRTYIQSGNAVFESGFNEKELLETIKTGFTARFGFACSVLVRRADELRALIEGLPFTGEEIAAAEAADPKTAHLYVYFLDGPPDISAVDANCGETAGEDRAVAGKRELYVLLQGSIRLSKLAVCLSKIYGAATVRNWKTVTKLYAMMTEQ